MKILGQSTFLKNIFILKIRKKLSQIFDNEKKKGEIVIFWQNDARNSETESDT